MLHTVTIAGFKTYLRLWHRLRVDGRDNIPCRTPFVICSNHASHLDAIVISTCLPRAVRSHTFPVAAGDVFFETARTAAFAAVALNALPMWRKRVGRHALEELRDRLRSGEAGYILFPEGGRTRDGVMLPFKPGVGMLVAGSSVPVVPAFIDGCFEACPAGGGIPRRLPIRIRIGAPISFDGIPDERDGWDLIAHRVQEAVTSLRDAMRT